jgi:hypothetical protein
MKGQPGSLRRVVEPLSRWIAVFWLLLVAACYLIMETSPLNSATNGTSRLSPWDRLDGPAVALLAVVLLAGIIRRLPGARGEPPPEGAPARQGPAAEAARDTR